MSTSITTEAMQNNLKQYNEAIKDYNQAIELDPKHANAYYNRGIAKALLKQYDEAIKDYNQAIELNPSMRMPITTEAL